MTPHQEKKLDEVHDAIIRIETAFLTIEKANLDHESRIRILEESKNITKGKVAAVIFLMGSGGVVGAVLTKFIK